MLRTSALLLAAIVVAAPAHAQQRQSDIKLTVKPGLDGYVATGEPFPVTVIVESTRAVKGDLALTSLSFNGVSSHKLIRAEVPAGGKKQFDLIMPPPINQTIATAFRLSDGRSLESQTTALSTDDAAMFVGVLGDESLPALRAVKSEPTGNSVRVGAFPLRWLDLGPDALQGLDYLVADSSVMRNASGANIETLFDWASSGGRLIVGSQDPSDNAWLPENLRADWLSTPAGWRPGLVHPAVTAGADAFSRPIGLGEAIFAGRSLNDLSADKTWWERTLYPRYSPGGRLQQEGGLSTHFEIANMLSQLSAGNVRLAWFLIFLIAYMLLVGPLNYIVLRKLGRKDLAWFTIPALALLFSAGAYGLAQGNRSGTSLEQAKMVLATPEGQSGSQVVTVTEASSGEMRLGFPSHNVELLGFEFGGPGRNTARREVRITANGAEAIIDAAPFSVHAARASLDEFPGTLDTTLTWDGTSVNAQVTNTTPYDLTDVTVITGGTEAKVGDLAPNKSATVNLTAQQVRNAFGRGGMFIDPGDDIEGSIRNALFNTFQSDSGLRGTFVPFAYGFANDVGSEVTLDGNAKRPKGKALIASTAKVSLSKSAVGSVPASVGHLQLLTGVQDHDGRMPAQFPAEPGIAFGGFGDVVFHYRIPAEVDRDRVASAALRIQGHLAGGQLGGPLPPQIVGPGENEARIDVEVREGGQQRVVAPRIEVYDWDARGWVELPSPQNFQDASIPVPLSVISPSGSTFIRIDAQQNPLVRLIALGIEPEVR
ncbi:MAG TPA: hypothetical protein VND22_07610 [Actinomycetota bacterium]|nr:hypothetical protein [Actinomycetota bacterium]